MALRRATGWIEYLDHDTGHWCNTCRLGTGMRIWTVFVTIDRSHATLQPVALRCTDCEGNDITINPDVVVS